MQAGRHTAAALPDRKAAPECTAGYTGAMGIAPILVWNGVETSNPQAVVSSACRAAFKQIPLAVTGGARVGWASASNHPATHASPHFRPGMCLRSCTKWATTMPAVSIQALLR